MKTLLTLMMVMLMTSTLAQGEHRTTINSLIMKADNIIYLLDDNAHMLRGRRNAEKRAEIDKVLEEAMKNIEGIIFKSHSVSLPSSFFSTLNNMCKSVNSWSGMRRCFVNGLQSETNFIIQVILSCNSISSDTGASNCFKEAMSAAVRGDNEYKLTYNSCSQSNSWNGMKNCFNTASDTIATRSAEVVKNGCGSISSDTGASNCYKEAYQSLGNDTGASLKRVIKNSCRKSNSWNGMKRCFVNGLELLKNDDVEIRLVLNSCREISSDVGSSNCFINGL
jgi:hypothetical protein